MVIADALGSHGLIGAPRGGGGLTMRANPGPLT